MRLLAVGDLNVDIILYVSGIPKEGGEEHARDLSISPGGSAANVAVAFRRLGGESWFYGSVGDDVFGNWLIGLLKDVGVNTEFVSRRDRTTGTMVILSTERDRTIIGFRGANEMLVYPREEMWDRGFDAVFVSGYSFLGENLSRILKLLESASERGVKVYVDASGVFAHKGLDLLKQTRMRIHGLLMNEVEAQEFFRGGDPGNYLWLADEIVVKMGSKGSVVYHEGGSTYVKAFPIDTVVDTTGAGDVFDAAYIFASFSGLGYRERLLFANASAAIKITRKGGWSSPRLEEVLEFLRSKGVKISLNK